MVPRQMKLPTSRCVDLVKTQTQTLINVKNRLGLDCEIQVRFRAKLHYLTIPGRYQSYLSQTKHIDRQVMELLPNLDKTCIFFPFFLLNLPLKSAESMVRVDPSHYSVFSETCRLRNIMWKINLKGSMLKRSGVFYKRSFPLSYCTIWQNQPSQHQSQMVLNCHWRAHAQQINSGFLFTLFCNLYGETIEWWILDPK